MSAWFVLLVCGLYGAGLVAAAWAGGRERHAGSIARRAPTLYALALAVYCTSWTFYGAVGTAAVSGWSYLPIYLGPILVFVFAFGFVRRLVRQCQRHNISTLSDFLAARYGRSRALAGLVTSLVAIGALPYIALQLKSVSMTFQALTTGDFVYGGEQTADYAGVALTAAALAAFAILFGARTADAASGNRGIMVALAVESVVKLAALVAVALVAWAQLASPALEAAAPVSAGEQLRVFSAPTPALDFMALTVIAMAAIMCLPRQFHVTVTEAPRPNTQAAIGRARWLFPAYLVVTSLAVIPIALAGARLPAGTASPDLFVLAVPSFAGSDVIALAAFLGGLSAATGMVIVSCIALSTMISNDLIVPVMMRLRRASEQAAPFGEALVAIRRSVILGLMVGATLYLYVAGSSTLLAEIGLISFVAVAQLAPALVGALLWSRGHRIGALTGVALGGLVWLYTLVFPALVGGEAGLSPAFNAFGGVFYPYGLMGLSGLDPVTHAALVSLAVNIAAYVGLSLRARPKLIDQVQSLAFTRQETTAPPAPPRTIAPGEHHAGVSAGDLKTLAERFLSPEAVRRAFNRFGQELGAPVDADAPADWRLVQRTERLLAGALGSSTARIVLGSALSNADVPFADMLSVLDETNDERRFKRHLVQATLENIGQGVSVIDKDLRLVAWNGLYIDMFRFPAGLVHVGRPIEDVLRYMAERGELGLGDMEAQVARRLEHYRGGGPHKFEREHSDGRILRIEGNPMPGGGYVSTFTDVTSERRAERALREANEDLERRVAHRTQTLMKVAEERDQARRRAERSEATKTRFLAAASHDLQQPLNAARLFAAALSESLSDTQPGEARLAEGIDRSIRSADAMLRSLLDLSRFDAEGFEPSPTRFAVQDLFEELEHSHRPIAQKAGLGLRVRPTQVWVEADRDLLRSVLQNLLSNALRYTEEGGVLLAARHVPGSGTVTMGVWDTGPGVPEEARRRIFQEFRRLHEVDRSGERGAGLGLAIAARAARLLGASVDLRSRQGRGSVFSITLPVAHSSRQTHQEHALRPPHAVPAAPAAQISVLCLDDEPNVLHAMAALLSRWGYRPVCVGDPHEARRVSVAEGPFTVALFDYHLAGEETGLEVLQSLRARGDGPAMAAILSADQSEEVVRAVREAGFDVIAKPVDARMLQTFLQRAVLTSSAAE